jgi:hypothetical protein
LEAADIVPEAIIDHCLVKKGNTTIPQVKLTWVGLPRTTTTWEDYNVIKQRFPMTLAWGASWISRGEVSHLAMVTRLARKIEEGED